MLVSQSIRHYLLLLDTRDGQTAIRISVSQAAVLTKCNSIPLKPFKPATPNLGLSICMPPLRKGSPSTPPKRQKLGGCSLPYPVQAAAGAGCQLRSSFRMEDIVIEAAVDCEGGMPAGNHTNS